MPDKQTSRYHLQGIGINLPETNLAIIAAGGERALVAGEVDAGNAMRGRVFAPQHNGHDEAVTGHRVSGIMLVAER